MGGDRYIGDVKPISSFFAVCCSYSYDVVASMEGGHVIFAIDPKSRQQPDCIRRIEVIAKNQRSASWQENVAHQDGCANHFPLSYGERLKGHPQERSETVIAEPLQRGVIYEISSTTGATGYGSGRFVIHPDGRIENLPFRDD